MPSVRSPKVLAREKDVYEALAGSFRACIAGETDRATAVTNFSYLSAKGRWLVHFGPDAPIRFADDAHEFTSTDLRERFGLKPPKAPSKAEVLSVARRLVALAADTGTAIPDGIIEVLFHGVTPPELPEVDDTAVQGPSGAVVLTPPPLPDDEDDDLDLIGWLDSEVA